MSHFLFDLDGTLGDTLPLCIAAFRKAIAPLAGRELSDAEIIATFGPSEEGTIRALLPGNADEGLKSYLACYGSLHEHWPNPFQGVADTLRFIKAQGGFLGLVTGKGPLSTKLTLTQYGFNSIFDVVKTGAASGPVKDVRIEEVIAEHSLVRENVLYVGDAPSDVTAARACHVRVAAAAWAPTADVTELTAMQPDFLFQTVDEFSLFVRRSYANR